MQAFLSLPPRFPVKPLMPRPAHIGPAYYSRTARRSCSRERKVGSTVFGIIVRSQPEHL
jgi:hypothetical protein